jgi:DNA-binding transcriptional regulator YhcF (GntR family)
MPSSTPPPYQRIADSLRRRIEAGQLAPGARVPSTRALAKKWNVALATAAHALSTLTAEGWVRAVPRVGTIVAPRASKRGPERSTELSQATIVQAAIAIADAEGFAALSLRGVAVRLGAPVTSLYRHVDGKEALLRAMTESALSEASLPLRPPPGWRAQLEVSARLHFRVLRAHPWLARVLHVTRPRPVSSAISYANWVLRALDGHGLSASQRMYVHIALHAFIQGMAVNLEAEADALGETGLSEDAWMSTQLQEFKALAMSGHYPFFAKTLGELDRGFDLSMDALFETGLQALLDGFAKVIQPR